LLYVAQPLLAAAFDLELSKAMPPRETIQPLAGIPGKSPTTPPSDAHGVK
jgi:hypothetical protein